MKVCVMMSTYNGEKYIKEQIDSLFAQSGVEVDLYIRDDGSKDKTVNIIEKLSTHYSTIYLEKGENIGYAKSFFHLLKHVPDTYNYYGFADQDDVWYTNKLEKAISVLGEVEGPCLYCCNLELVDEALNYIETMKAPEESDFNYGRYLIDKYSYGCTMVFNSALFKLLVANIPQEGISHDNWVGLTAVFCGKFVFDETVLIKYRQHANNVTGGKTGIIESWKRRLKNINQIDKLSRAILASEILSHYEKYLDDDKIALLNMVSQYKKSINNTFKFFFDKATRRKSREKDLIFRCMILLRKA